MNVFFLAAGLGTRLRPLTLNVPKPAVPFLNVPMAYYQFRFLQELKIDSCVANAFHLPEKIKELYNFQSFLKNKIQVSDEHPAILGSAGGLKKASALFGGDETILMMNADEIFFTKQTDFLQKAYEQHIQNGNLATLVTMQHPEAGKKFGAIWCEGNRAKHIGKENTDPNLKPRHYIGIIFLNKKVLNFIPNDSETNIFYDILINHLSTEKVETFSLDCNWYETGNWNDYFAATKEVLQNMDEPTLDFINQYDSSRLLKNPSGVSLVSTWVKVDESSLTGYNVIAGGSQNIPAHVHNSVIFNGHILNSGYFS